jgi:hypothetical protein
MDAKDKEFYKGQYPCLKDENWWYTGAESTIKNVWWRLNLPDTQYEDIFAKTEINLQRSPTYATFFVQVENKEYPQQLYTKKLNSDPEKASSAQVMAEAKHLASLLLAEKASEMRDAREKWEEELTQMKSYNQK